ncbi:peptide/nickel transport system substrate-binding protein [Halorubrum xinjiangense]|uniref:Peptide/nickel transport system substrate-binding protein n=2 Tax=Halorubrum xinjiangense TaxID=261291 RepID=A0A1G7GZ15_9EURY|nr:ABC transporter substrate-binding protein [Halorubrum xinjiangense]SDE93408.1 peptide/nickel transport system substrate-binding protein [Halorubrum xinjiangense]
MPSRHNASNNNQTINRRNVIATIGAAGAASLAGCGGQSDGGDGGDGSDGSDGGDGELFPLDVQLEVNADNSDRLQMVELIAESMEQTGYFNTTVETYEWNTYVGRVLDPEYQNNGYVPCIGLSGTFNPGSFCNALHHSSNIGACCNLNGISDSELDEMMDDARYGVEVAEDSELRGERYDEVWNYLAEERYSSITHFNLATSVSNTDIHGFEMWPFQEGMYSYNMFAPQDEQIMWIDRDNAAGDSDLSDLTEGGTMSIAIGANIESFDPPHSSDTTSTLAQGFIYEGLIANDTQGNVHPWLAESYELIDTTDVDRTAYADYMSTVGTTEEGAVDTDEQVIVQHPEDSPAEDDEVRVLLPDDAVEAAEDGTYGMQYRYNLQEGVEFHNGDELTAEDVVATYEYAENSVLAPQTFDSVLTAVEVDEYTVDIYAQVADAEAERSLPALSILNATQIGEVEKGTIDPREGNTPIGTGPYEFSEFEDEQYFEVTKFDNYWTEQKGVSEAFSWFDGSSDFPDGPVIDGFEVEIVPDDSTRSGALQNGEIDSTYGLNSSTLDEFDSSEDFLLYEIETGGYEYIQYPVNVAPFDDARLRQAINHLIPRERIVENVFSGYGRPAWTPIPQLAQGSGTADAEALEDELRPMNEYNVERAEELLEQVAADN